MTRPIALVTGASSGIGAELARKLDARGYQVVLVARSQPALEQLAAALHDAIVVVADLSSPEGRQVVTEAVPRVDLLVNNAGFGAYGELISLPEAQMVEMVEVNCTALVALTSHYLPQLVERREGAVLNIASTAAFQAGPTMAVYFASKAFVLSFTEAVAEEVRSTPVVVTAFCPGAFTSGFQARAQLEESKLVKGRSLPSAASMADAALKALDAKKVVAIPGLVNKVGAHGTRFVPRAVLRRAVAYVQAEA